MVSSAPELARVTLNIAGVHHDSRLGGLRLVYGGHTIGLALAQASKLLPNLATVLGWQSCDHTAPVYEGDTLYSELQLNPPSRPTAAGYWDCGRWSTRSATSRTSHAMSWTGVSRRCSSEDLAQQWVRRGGY